MIKKIGDKYKVTTSSGDETLGTHSTKKAALAQLAAVEISKAKHMSEDKSFKSFRTTLSEAEYGEYVTGNSHRSAYNDDGTYRIQNPKMLNSINAMLAAIGHATYTDPMEAFNKIRVRLNVFLLDLDWKTFSDLKNKDVGSFVLPINRFGRVDGYDGNSGELRFDGKARDAEGLPAVNLHVDIQLTPDYLYTVHACLRPQGAAPPRSAISPAAATLKRNESLDIKEGTGYSDEEVKSGKQRSGRPYPEAKFPGWKVGKNMQTQKAKNGKKIGAARTIAAVKEDVEQVDEVLTDVSTRPIKPKTKSSTKGRTKRFASLLMKKYGIGAEKSHKGANFQTNEAYTNDDVATSDAAATLKTKIGKAKAAGETTRINPSKNPNAAARAADKAAKTISTGTKKLRRLNKIKTNEDTISEGWYDFRTKFPSTGRAGRRSADARKMMKKYNIDKSPENRERYRGAVKRSIKIDATREMRRDRARGIREESDSDSNPLVRAMRERQRKAAELRTKIRGEIAKDDPKSLTGGQKWLVKTHGSKAPAAKAPAASSAATKRRERMSTALSAFGY